MTTGIQSITVQFREHGVDAVVCTAHGVDAVMHVADDGSLSFDPPEVCECVTRAITARGASL